MVTYSQRCGTDYVKKYYDFALYADQWWANTNRKNYQADVWYNENRNRISLSMLTFGPFLPPGGGKILDIGARLWVERELLAALKGEIIKLDIIGGPDIITGDACNLPFADKSFDLVICRDVIEHVLDAEKAMQEAHRVLVDGGYYFLTTPNGYNVCPDGSQHVRAYTPFSLLKEMDNQGFEVVDKKGDIPNILHSLMPLADMGVKQALDEFKEMQELLKDDPLNYYTGTFLYVLARKK
jgi:SAM-dependent methyltransferase